MQVFNAKILQVSAGAAVKDAAVTEGLHLAFGDSDVFIDCQDAQERMLDPVNAELKELFSQAAAKGCHYIHLF